MKTRLLLYVSLLALASCISEKAPPVSIVCHPPSLVSFHQDILPIFNQYCNGSGCHSGTSPGGDLNLEPAQAYNDLMTPGSGYIDTVNPKFSLLYAQLNSMSDLMPPTGKLDTCTINLILLWIQQKAKNN